MKIFGHIWKNHSRKHYYRYNQEKINENVEEIGFFAFSFFNPFIGF